VIFLDTGFLFALVYADDVNHARVRQVFEGHRDRRLADFVLTTNHVVAETVTLLRTKAGTAPRARHALAVEIGQQLLAGTTTRPGILRKPLPLERSMAFVDEWLAQPYVRAVGPGEGHWAILRKLLRDTGTAGNLTSDAHLAAIAVELGASICSTDGDFARFPGVERISPLDPGRV